jgi:hypothetical protein
MSVLSPPLSKQDAKAPATPTPASSSVSKQVRPRASFAAAIALALAVAAVLTVATGVLAALGAALGLLAALFAVGGMAATRQRHVAGTGTAVLGLVLGLAALAVGALTVTGGVGWLDIDTSTNNVTRLQEWIDAHAPWLTPEI